MVNLGFKVMVEDYCEGCRDFDPSYEYFHYNSDDGICMSEYVILCKNRNKCARMYRHLQNKIEPEIEKDEEVDRWIL